MSEHITRKFNLNGTPNEGKDLELPYVGIKFKKGAFTFTGPEDQVANVTKLLTEFHGASVEDGNVQGDDETDGSEVGPSGDSKPSPENGPAEGDGDRHDESTSAGAEREAAEQPGEGSEAGLTPAERAAKAAKQQ